MFTSKYIKMRLSAAYIPSCLQYMGAYTVPYIAGLKDGHEVGIY